MWNTVLTCLFSSGVSLAIESEIKTSAFGEKGCSSVRDVNYSGKMLKFPNRKTIFTSSFSQYYYLKLSVCVTFFWA